MSHAEFMQVWEEGYVAREADFATMHAQFLLVLAGGELRDASGALDRPRIRRYVAARVASTPSFRLRLQRGVLGLTPPAWVPDDRFVLERHLRFSDAVLPLGRAHLRELSGWHEGPMSLRHPLWRFHVTELEGGDVAIGLILHHAMLDGLTAMALLSEITQAGADESVGEPVDPFDGVRPARAVELPLLAARAFARTHPSPTAAWRGLTAKPVGRRARRVGGRLMRPWRQRRARRGSGPVELPQRTSDFTTVEVPVVLRQARAVGGTMGDLLAASLIRTSLGEPEVHIRYPVSHHAGSTISARNHVRDMAVYGHSDDDLATLVASVKQQVASEGAAFPEARRVGRQIGYTTLVPWLSRPRFFAGAPITDVIGFAAALTSDEIAAAALMYDGRLTLTVTTQPDGDPTAAVATLRQHMTGSAPLDRSTP